MTQGIEETVLPGTSEPQPCAACGTLVYSDLQQDYTQKIYNKVMCCDCEQAHFWELL